MRQCEGAKKEDCDWKDDEDLVRGISSFSIDFDRLLSVIPFFKGIQCFVCVLVVGWLCYFSGKPSFIRIARQRYQ